MFARREGMNYHFPGGESEGSEEEAGATEERGGDGEPAVVEKGKQPAFGAAGVKKEKQPAVGAAGVDKGVWEDNQDTGISNGHYRRNESVANFRIPMGNASLPIVSYKLGRIHIYKIWKGDLLL